MHICDQIKFSAAESARCYRISQDKPQSDEECLELGEIRIIQIKWLYVHRDV
jgi:hypothetical protein